MMIINIHRSPCRRTWTNSNVQAMYGRITSHRIIWRYSSRSGGRMIKKWWKKIDRIVTAPLLYYLILICASCFAFVVTEYSKDTEYIRIIKNVGYGIFGSTFVAFLIDYASTKRKKDHDIKELYVLTHTLRSIAKELLKFRIKHGGILDAQYKDVEYNKWVLELPKYEVDCNGGKRHLHELMSTLLELLLNAAVSLKENSVLLANNSCLPDYFFIYLDRLILATKTMLDEGECLEAHLFIITIEDVLESIAGIMPEFQHILFDKWNPSEIVQIFKE